MTHTTRRFVLLGITGLVLLLFAALVVTTVRADLQRGWAGFGFQAAVPADMPIALPFVRASGRVLAIAAGSPAERAGIKAGDVVEAIGSTPIANLAALRTQRTELHPGDTVEVTLRREHLAMTMPVVLSSSLRSPQILVGVVSSVVTGVVYLAISLLVGWVQPRSRAAWVFFLMSATGAAFFLGWALVEPEISGLCGLVPIGTDLRLVAVFAAFVLFSVVLANLLFHLVLVFPEERPVLRRWPEVLHWIHTVPFLPAALIVILTLGFEVVDTARAAAVFVIAALALLALWVVRLVRRAHREGLRRALLASPWSVQGAVLAAAAAFSPAIALMPSGTAMAVGIVTGALGIMVVLLITLVWSVLTCVELSRGFRTAGADARHQLRWPVWGTLVAVGGSGIIVVVLLVVGAVTTLEPPASTVISIGASSLSKLIYCLIPLSFAFGILKYRLMAIDVIVRKTVVYAGLTGFIVVGYFLIVGVFGVLLVAVAGVRSQILTVIATVVVAVLLVPARNRIQAFVDRRLFRRERAFGEAREQLAAHVRSSNALTPLLAWMADELQAALGSRTVAILVREPPGRRLRAAATVGLSDSVRSIVALSSDGRLAGSATDVVRVEPSAENPDDAEALNRTGAHLAALARHRGEVLGIILVGGELARKPYDDEDERFLADAAAELALALATLQPRRMELEFDEARELQRSLLPQRLEQIDGVEVAAHWEPAREVSGDTYDVVRLDRHRLGLVIGDVAGKGMSAALLMSSLQAAVKAVATADTAPEVLCERVRAVVRQNLTGGRFTTLFYGILDRSAGTLAYCNAGHTPPLLLRRDGSAEWLVNGGPVIARLLADLPYQGSVTAVAPGDVVALFTDGVTEATSPSGDLFGEDRVVATLRTRNGEPASELARRLAERARTFAAGDAQDDVTVVVARVV